VVSRSNKESRPNQSVDGGGKVVEELVSDRTKTIDDAVDAATAPAPKPKEEAPKNPYPEGSARAKLWARREADKKKE
jgi:ABC-type uncharacterized transport system involved in gliding motility auxiliary subunit